jgi:hypothetical protein
MGGRRFLAVGINAGDRPSLIVLPGASRDRAIGATADYLAHSGFLVLRRYLLVAGGFILVRIVALATGAG